MFIWRGEVDAHPKKLLQVRIGPRDKVRLREGLPGDFVDCVRRGRRTCAPVEVAHRSTTLCSIAAIGMLLGRKLTWDPAREEFVRNFKRFRSAVRAHLSYIQGIVTTLEPSLRPACDRMLACCTSQSQQSTDFLSAKPL